MVKYRCDSCKQLFEDMELPKNPTGGRIVHYCNGCASNMQEALDLLSKEHMA